MDAGQLSRRHFLAVSTGTAAIGVTAAMLPPGVAHAAPTAPDLGPWNDPDVVFDDDAHSLTDAGWVVRPPVAGAYILDSVGSAGNPHQLDLPEVAEGQYHLYADEVSQAVSSYASMSRQLDIGPGAWQLELRMRIDDLVRVHEIAYSRGLVLGLNANGQRFNFALVNRDRMHVLYGRGSNSHERQVPVPFDGAFHDWIFRFDGVDTTIVAIDGVTVATLRDVNVPGAGADAISVSVLALNWADGRVAIALDRLRVTRRRTATVLGPAASLAATGWVVDPAAEGAYITDHERSSGVVPGMTPTAVGECQVVARDAGPVLAHHDAGLGTGAWALRFSAKCLALPAASAIGTRGLVISVDAGGRRVDLGLVDGRAGLRDNRSGEWLTAPTPSGDEKFHAWTLARDDAGRYVVELDGRIVLITSEDITAAAPGGDGLVITADGRGAASAVDVALSGFVLARDVTTAFHQPSIDAISITPISDADGLVAVVGVSGVDPLELASGAVQLTAVLSAADSSGSELARRSVVVDQRYLRLELDPGGRAGELRLDLRAQRGAEVVATSTQRWLAPATVAQIDPGDEFTPHPGAAGLFGEPDLCRTIEGTPAAAAGWTPASYALDGADLAGVFLDSTAQAEPIIVPVSISGWCSIRIGYVSGTEAFEVTVGDRILRTAVPGAPKFDPDKAFGPRALGEIEVFTGELTANQLTIAAVSDKQSRIAHVRVIGLSEEEIALVRTPDEGEAGTRAIYNNDGISDFFSGRYETVAELRANAVDVYRDADVGAWTWQAGTTFFLTYDSEWAGRPYASLTPPQQDLMRDGDVVAMEAILRLVDEGLVPLEVVSGRASEIGVATYAGLRMDTFYPMTSYPWYNGNLWSSYQDCLQTAYDGTVNTRRMAYTNQKFADHIRNVLIELAGFSDVTGVDLDFTRYPEVVGWEPATMTAYQAQYGIDPRREVTADGSRRWQQFRADLMTKVLRELRAAVPGKRVIARVPQANPLAYGLDIASWVAEGLVDILVPTSISHEQFWPNLAEFVDLVAGTDIQLYGGTTHTLSGNDLSKQEQELAERGYASGIVRTQMTPEMYAERAGEFYQAGYDGVYIFNHWRGTASLGMVGDKVHNAKWVTFSLPATWVQNALTAEATAADTIADLADLLTEWREDDELAAGPYHRFRARVDLASHALETGRREGALESLERLVTDVRSAETDDHLSSWLAARLVAETSRVAGRL